MEVLVLVISSFVKGITPVVLFFMPVVVMPAC
jgi:hypothetical protein